MPDFLIFMVKSGSARLLRSRSPSEGVKDSGPEVVEIYRKELKNNMRGFAEQEKLTSAVKTVNLGGWPVVVLDRQGFARIMADDCLAVHGAANSVLPRLAFSINGQALSLAETDREFRSAMQAADYIQADGQSFVFASKILTKSPLPERIATTDFFHDAASIAQEKKLKFYLLGASEEVSRRAFETIKKLYPDLIIAGCRNGYFEDVEEKAICQEIVRSGADVLWVGLGKPKEQIFCIRNRENLRGVAWIKTCGGLFDFLSGRNIRAPRWMQITGFEWLHRMIHDPRRFFWRYLTTNIYSIFLFLRYR